MTLFSFKNTLIAFITLLLCLSLHAEQVQPSEAGNYVGEVVAVCGKVAAADYAEKSAGSPTFLDFTAAYPAQDFTAVIWGADRPKFGKPPEEMYRDKVICVRGTIQIYRKKPVIFVDTPARISFVTEEPTPDREEIRYRQAADYNRTIYRPVELKGLKAILAAAGQKPADMSERWDRATHDLVMSYQKGRKLKSDGRVDRRTLMELEKDVRKNESAPYKERVYFFNEIQKLLKKNY